MITLEVGARVSIARDDLPQDVGGEIRELFSHGNPAYYREKARRGWSRDEPTVETWAEDECSLSVPRGGLRAVRAVLEHRGLEWDEVDRLCDGDSSVPPYTGDYVTPRRFPEPRLIPWPHQEQMVQAALERECALLLVSMGGGKTAAGLMIAAATNLPTVVLVWERNLMQQWLEDIRDVLGIDPDDVGVVQGKRRKIRSITLAMQQTLNLMDPGERLELLSQFGTLIADEAQRAAATTFTRTIDEAPCRFRVAVTGGVNRKDGKKFLVTDLFGQPALEVSRKQMVDAGVVHDVSAVLVPTDFEAEWYLRQRLNKRLRPDFTRLIAEMTADEDRNALCLGLVLKRAAELRRPALVFTHRVEHARLFDQMLRAHGVSSGLLLGGNSERDDFARNKAALKSGRLLVGVGTYQALGVGQNLPAVEVGFALTPVHGHKDYFGQVTARMCRRAAGKDSAEVVVPWDRHVFGDRPLRAVARWYRNTSVLHAGAMIPPAQYLRDYPQQRAVDDDQDGTQTQHGTADDVFS